MPSFCRHNRFEDKCPICSRVAVTRPGTVSAAGSTPRRVKTDKPSGKRRAPRAGDLVVRRVTRAAEDGYENDLVPGLRSSEDARRLATELAFAEARLAELRSAPPGLLAIAASEPDREEALWLTFLIAYLSPLQDDGAPFEAIDAVRTTWASGELPDLDEVRLGSRTAHVPGGGPETLVAYRARAEKAGGQMALLSGETALSPARRFDLAFQRLALPRLHRAPRFEFLVLAGGLGLIDAQPSSLVFGAEATDPATLAAKRVFGIGDAINLQRRATELVVACGISAAALDLALVNWARGADDRITAGSSAVADPVTVENTAGVLGVAEAPAA